ncbi:MAG: hypothetical protein HC848_08690 [Limnobacter sp.]|nr:hypothetical protein [Limnobacter sp.]
MQAESSFLQLLPPLVVGGLLILACYHFYTSYYLVSKQLSLVIQRIASTVRSMTEGDPLARKEGVGKVFKNTPLEKNWSDFAKTLHPQKEMSNGAEKLVKYRMTVPATHFFSVSNVVDRHLKVEYFKHLPGILTGLGIIGTFSGLLFGLAHFDASTPQAMNESVSLLLGGVRDAFYASASAITVAMIITHLEKLLYQRCVVSLEDVIDAVDNLFEVGVGEEYLSRLVKSSNASNEQAKHLREELIQAMAPVFKQMEKVQDQQAEVFASSLQKVLSESNRYLASQIDSALARQTKVPLENLAKKMEDRMTQSTANPQELVQRVIRARAPQDSAS